MSRIIGIDLGTTNSCVAVLDAKGQPTTLAGLDNERTTPSWVSWSTSGQIAVGTRAKRQAVTNASATVYGVKRMIGRKVNAEDVSWFAREAGVPLVFWFWGGADPVAFAAAQAAGTVERDIPTNHSPFFAPVLQPTLGRGVDALVVAAREFLGSAPAA